MLGQTVSAARSFETGPLARPKSLFRLVDGSLNLIPSLSQTVSGLASGVFWNPNPSLGQTVSSDPLAGSLKPNSSPGKTVSIDSPFGLAQVPNFSLRHIAASDWLSGSPNPKISFGHVESLQVRQLGPFKTKPLARSNCSFRLAGGVPKPQISRPVNQSLQARQRCPFKPKILARSHSHLRLACGGRSNPKPSIGHKATSDSLVPKSQIFSLDHIIVSDFPTGSFESESICHRMVFLDLEVGGIPSIPIPSLFRLRNRYWLARRSTQTQALHLSESRRRLSG